MLHELQDIMEIDILFLHEDIKQIKQQNTCPYPFNG